MIIVKSILLGIFNFYCVRAELFKNRETRQLLKEKRIAGIAATITYLWIFASFSLLNDSVNFIFGCNILCIRYYRYFKEL